ncbi:MAG: saccharopine dehydrogenase family protein [Actinomycetota bacterium]
MILLYGATGFTGSLIAQHLAKLSWAKVILGGRSAGPLVEFAGALGLPTRVGSLSDLDLTEVTVVVNCAGPFSVTARPLIEQCLASGVHYLDLAGEVPEHRIAAEYDAAARKAGVLLLPGAGFGIVPSDILATRVTQALTQPVHLDLALKTVGGVSRGTASVVLGGLRAPGVYRHGGALQVRSAGARRLHVDFGDGDGVTTVVTNPWRADLLSVVPQVDSVEAFMAFPAPIRGLMRIPHGRLVHRLTRFLPAGPSEAALTRGRSAIWARATDADGSTATATLTGPDAYLFTAFTVAECLRAIYSGAPSGYHTPVAAFGTELLDNSDGVTLSDVATHTP